MTVSWVIHLLYAAFIDPSLVQHIVQGTQPAHVTADWLKKQLPLPIAWTDQRQVMGLL
ncbi:hypothetical protein [Ottowia testudinis]|uniref:Uncharacterized protein n=1 Tax=Ottowia testudinis TaxID=2816950 RepID=A0A975CHN1_9BURK|nr:hypothetical protein [Ottowia testudinis]QTD46375.1 hypothetical protein J1M35_05655 [Ottowia testudinis]